MRHIGLSKGKLALCGPLVQVQFQLHEADLALINPKPAPVSAKVMVDTGAAITCVHESVPDQLKATPIGVIDLCGVSGKPEPRPVFRLTMILTMATNHGEILHYGFHSNIVSTSAHTTSGGEECMGLIGRNFLKDFTFTYDGQMEEFYIECADPYLKPQNPVRAMLNKKKIDKQLRKGRG